ncbi:MAG: Coenzyme F420 hydrogenase/dehydrogenase, beta subunit C-terminal domain [Candidatus Lokiarchaeota archaeon]|nr:Coenzyme F420 hydrogenase/dehydrogenase, beta subunit C-terminal domain [Candidatus Lokiarchaeota archaeon]
MMFRVKNDYNFGGVPLHKLLYATYKASNNFHYRALFKAKDDILKIGKYNKAELNMILDSIFEAETARKYLFEELKNSKPLKAREIIKRFPFPKENVIRDLFYMKEKGLIEVLDADKEDPLFKIRADLKKSEENYFISVDLVYDSNLCCQCGLCSSICPVNAIDLRRDYLYVDESKCITCGLCYEVCPRSFRMDALMENIYRMDKSLKYTDGLGYYKDIYSARTRKYSIKKLGQDGGIATSLLYYLLEQKLVDAVITIKHLENYWEPEVSIIEKAEELHKTAGSTYVHFPVLSILHKAKKYDKIALVALPCKIKAISKGKLIPIKLPMFRNIKYKIGLFCMESFPYEEIFKLIKDKFSVSIDEIIKMDIKSGVFELTVDSGEKYSLSLNDCKVYCSQFCHFCGDLTAEFADISLGSIGSNEGWSTVITRSDKGEKIFKNAIKNHLIEIKSSFDESPVQSKIKRVAEKKKENIPPIEIQAF